MARLGVEEGKAAEILATSISSNWKWVTRRQNCRQTSAKLFMSFRDRFGAEGRSVTLLTTKSPLNVDVWSGVRMTVDMVAISKIRNRISSGSLWKGGIWPSGELMKVMSNCSALLNQNGNFALWLWFGAWTYQVPESLFKDKNTRSNWIWKCPKKVKRGRSWCRNIITTQI
jgi:hypothetical protein